MKIMFNILLLHSYDAIHFNKYGILRIDIKRNKSFMLLKVMLSN